MEEILKRLPEKAKDKKKENRKFFSKLKKRPPKDLDSIMLELHEDEFSRMDCLNCANCCKTTGPLFTQKDIERISKHFRMKPGEFIDSYLRLDEDNDFVLQSVPCPFLGADNYCSIYDKRPKACREYPHTDRKDIHKISQITIRNTAVCPAAFNIVEEMKKRLNR